MTSCDTFVVLPDATADGSTLFGKNSDRHANESSHVVQVLRPALDAREAYVAGTHVQVDLREVLGETQARVKRHVLLCKPTWMWGAEMGSNDVGVVMGNEALFARVPTCEEVDGQAPPLLGMDLLRVVLQRAETAVDAVHLLGLLIERLGQGGNCEDHATNGQTKHFHNAFLICDPTGEAWVLESVGREWAAQQHRSGVVSISNFISLDDDFSLQSKNLGDYAVASGWCESKESFSMQMYQDQSYTWLGSGQQRAACTSSFLERRSGRVVIADAMDCLRQHAASDPIAGVLTSASVCMHHGAGPARPARTTNSMVTVLPWTPRHVWRSADGQGGALFTNWVTCTSAPCLSVYKPYFLPSTLQLGREPGLHFDSARSVWWKHELLVRLVEQDYARLAPAVRERYAQLEQQFLSDVGMLFLSAGRDEEGDDELAQISVEQLSQLSRNCFEQADELTTQLLDEARQTVKDRNERGEAPAANILHRRHFRRLATEACIPESELTFPETSVWSMLYSPTGIVLVLLLGIFLAYVDALPAPPLWFSGFFSAPLFALPFSLDGCSPQVVRTWMLFVFPGLIYSLLLSAFIKRGRSFARQRAHLLAPEVEFVDMEFRTAAGSEEGDYDADVIVVGAGVSGMNAARELSRRGVSVLVLEGRDRVGGRTVTVTEVPGVPDGVCDLGGQWVGPTQTRLLELLEEFEMETYGQRGTAPEDGKSVVCVENQRAEYTGVIPFIRSSLGVQNVGVLLDSLRMLKQIDRMAEQVPLDAPWNAPKAREWDAMSVADYGRTSCITSQSLELLRPMLEVIWAAEPHEVSLLFFLFYVHSAGGIDALTENDPKMSGAQSYKVKGGMQQVSECLAEAIGTERVLLEHRVVAVDQDEDGAGGVSVSFITSDGEESSLRARRVVLAMAPVLCGRLRYDPPLPSARDRLTQAFPMGSIIKMIIFYDTPFWIEAGFNGLAIDSSGPVCTIMDSSCPDGTFHALCCFVAGEPARLLAEQPQERRQHAVLTQLRLLFDNDASMNPAAFMEKNWGEEIFSRGCYVGYTPPGVLTAFGRTLREPIGRVHFAGTETAQVWNGYIEGAIRAGDRVAREVAALIPLLD